MRRLIAGEYEVRGLLGAGGFGVVYHVFHKPTDSMFALKAVRADQLSDPASRLQFRREARIWIEMGPHVNLVRAHHVVEFESQIFLALEHVAAGADGVNSLEGYLRGGAPLDLRQALLWAIQLCDGMTHAYDKGLQCHRDIKPANILISPDRVLKISDLGLASALVSSSRQRSIVGRPGVPAMSAYMEDGTCGTPTHMSPEQFIPGMACDARTDIYSFGIVLFQMAHGRLPFLASLPKNASEAEAFRFWNDMHRLHTHAQPPASTTALGPVISRCLEKDPRRRYPSFAALRDDLAGLLLRHFGESAEPAAAHETQAWELVNRGGSLTSLGEHDQALACYDAALRIDPSLSSAWTNKALSLAHLGRLHAALDCINHAIRLSPRDPVAWNNKVTLLHRLGRPEDALACCDRVLRLEPDSSAGWLNKGNLLLDAGRYAEAGACYDKAVHLNPQSGGAWFRRGLCRQLAGQWREGIACFDAAIKMHPEELNAWYAKASCLSELGQHREALAVLSEAAINGPMSASAWLIRAGIEERLSLAADAAASLQHLIESAGVGDEELIAFARARLQQLR